MDWSKILDVWLDHGFAATKRLLSEQDCQALRDEFGSP